MYFHFCFLFFFGKNQKRFWNIVFRFNSMNTSAHKKSWNTYIHFPKSTRMTNLDNWPLQNVTASPTVTAPPPSPVTVVPASHVSTIYVLCLSVCLPSCMSVQKTLLVRVLFLCLFYFFGLCVFLCVYDWISWSLCVCLFFVFSLWDVSTIINFLSIFLWSFGLPCYLYFF